MADQKITLKSSEAVLSTLPESLTDEYQKKYGELIELTTQQEARLKAWIRARLDEWESDTADERRNLAWDLELTEGIVPNTDWPFEGASNVHVPITETYMDIFETVEKRSILGADLIWYAETDDEFLLESDVIGNIEMALNYHARNKWNIQTALKSVFQTTNRDGLGIMQVSWVEDYETSEDIVFITNSEEFQREFPTPESAGVSAEDYKELNKRAQRATDEIPLEIPITFEKRVYYGNKGEVVNLSNFVRFPANIQDVRDPMCRMYGKIYPIRGGMIRQKAQQGMFYKQAANKLLAGGSKSNLSEFDTIQNEIEGINRLNLSDDYDLFELVIKGKLNGVDSDEPERKFLVTYSKNKDLLLSCRYYVYRADCYALFRIKRRANRMKGRSIPEMTRDMNDEIDTQHNQRINSRTISTVPTFKALKSKKRDIDLMLDEQKWGPGRVIYLEDFNYFDQFKIQPADLGQSLKEETNDKAILDLRLGSSAALLSGHTPTGDPDAPGNKTALLLQQSNVRMDDSLEELREGVEQVGDICLSHLYQFGPPVIKFALDQSVEGQTTRQIQTIHKKYLRNGISMKMSGVSVIHNPDSEMQKSLAIHSILMQEPLYATNPALRIRGLKDALRKGRVQGHDKKLPSHDKIMAMMVEVQKKAMIQLELEKRTQEKQQREDQIQDRIKQIRTKNKIQNLASAVVDENLNQGVSPNGTNQ